MNPFNYRCWPALSIAPCMPLGRSFCHLDPRPWVICGSQAHDLCLPVIKDEYLNCVWICDPNSLTNKIIDISSESDSFFIFFSLFHKKYNLKFEKKDKNSVLYFLELKHSLGTLIILLKRQLLLKIFANTLLDNCQGMWTRLARWAKNDHFFSGKQRNLFINSEQILAHDID